ncbi:MAG: transposon-encoded TnpW family protein [Clostridiales bacterium]|nr:transposon-encoded TnpW family protein [Clostridiales bacterium]
MEVKIGKTNYIVVVKQAETAKKSAETVFRDMCRHEVSGDFSNAPKFSLEKISKIS